MRVTYFSPKPNHGVLALRQTPHGMSIMTLHSRNSTGQESLLYQLCKEADIHQMSLLIDGPRARNPAFRGIVGIYSFKPIRGPTGEVFALCRRPQSNIDSIGIHVRPYVMDFREALLPTVNEHRATHFVVLNAYGDRLAVFEEHREACSFLEKSRA